MIGAGQAGLAASYFLQRRGVDHVVLDANPRPGGAWQHRWDSLGMDDVHGVADLPDASAPPVTSERANLVVPDWFTDYERRHHLPVLRPVRVDRVDSDGDLLVVRAGEREWWTRTLVNATGTWTRPFVPYVPGIATFAGEQLHTADYPGPEHFRGRRVLVVGGGASAVQHLGICGNLPAALPTGYSGGEATGEVRRHLDLACLRAGDAAVPAPSR